MRRKPLLQSPPLTGTHRCFGATFAFPLKMHVEGELYYCRDHLEHALLMYKANKQVHSLQTLGTGSIISNWPHSWSWHWELLPHWARPSALWNVPWPSYPPPPPHITTSDRESESGEGASLRGCLFASSSACSMAQSRRSKAEAETKV